MISAINNKIRSVFDLDLRSLAVFRIMLGIIVLGDLWARLVDLKAHYSDLGILPRQLALTSVNYPWEISLHMISGQWQVQAVIFALHMVAALCLIFGFHTRKAIVVTWLLTLSLHYRNTLLLHGGDSVIKLLLFWGQFLPLGARYSIDRALDTGLHNHKHHHWSMAGVALVVQLALIYLCTGILKSDPMWTSNFQATFYALSGEPLTSVWGKELLPYKGLLEFLTVATLVLEIVGPILLFVPYRNQMVRLGVCCAFISFHLGIAATMDIGNFPYICIAAWVALLPTKFWGILADRIYARKARGVTIYYDEGCLFCLKTSRILRTVFVLPDAEIIPAQSLAEKHEKMLHHNSWVVSNSEGDAIKGAGLLKLMELSPLVPFGGRWLGFSLPVLNKFYEFCAARRRALSSLTKPLPLKPLPPIGLSLTKKIFVSLCLGYVCLWNLSTLPGQEDVLPEDAVWVGELMGLTQEWSMFAPFPGMANGWYVVKGHFASGEVLDVWQNQELSYSRPDSIKQNFGNDRWTKYLMGAWHEEAERYLSGFGDYLCEKWNSRGGDHLEEIRISFMLEQLQRDYQPPRPVEELKIFHWVCARGADPEKGLASRE